ncbi:MULTISPECIES: hypothetical protein [unclassified Lentimonas]|uniref:hypothetical protein n=1 Tax=unclassified Lentimonas TaxID=2630993 RepID=UPI0013268801|nr:MULTISPECIES: hypothetical protein [unclassified Lentimonas]CAA6692830.1 Unannotated [Lentimonas sp. CC10]CAA6695545.1 Unannotated [Lentimonas sp. CC19]CAA7069876.1 Unannotated [Lentimonas sp. CC11]
MKTLTAPLSIYDANTDTTWTIPRRHINAVVAEVSERWVANVIVPEAVCRELIRVPFLEPIRTEAGYVLSLCAIFMKHAAPLWAPLNMGPASQTCALRIACVDTRDGSQAVWVDHRYSDSILVEALAKLGFPQVHAQLQVERGRDFYQHRQLVMSTDDNMIDLRLIEYPEAPTAEPQAFTDVQAFEDYFIAGVRSYGPGGAQGRVAMVDLHKRSDNHFEAMDNYHGYLRTAWGNWRVDGVYRTCNGRYEWRYEGDVAAEREEGVTL